MNLPAKKRFNRLSLEMIDIQDSSFGTRLEGAVGSIKEGIDLGEYKTYDDLILTKKPKEIEKIIFDRTGLKVDLIVNGDVSSILSFFVNKHHVFIKPDWRGGFTLKEQQVIINNANNKKGFVDLKKAKVGGVFSEYSNKLFLNFHILILEYKLTVKEIVAIMLHELGHAFYICEYSDRLESTNQVLANVAKEVLDKKQEKNLTYIYKELKSIDDSITPEIVEEIINGNKIVAGFKLFKVIANSVVGQLANTKYDETSFEQLADHFPSQFGYGKDLIIALNKMHEYFDNYEKAHASNSMNLLNSISNYLISTFLLIGFILSGSGMFLFSATLFITLTMLVSGDNSYDKEELDDIDTYDELSDRYKRIRNTYVEALKKSNLPNSELQEVVNNIYVIDNIIKESAVVKGFFDSLADKIFKSKKLDHKREQQLLENLAANDLFLKSVEFKIQA